MNGNLDEYMLTNVKYHHFNAGTTTNPFVAKAVYNADKSLNHYEFSVSNGEFYPHPSPFMATY